MTVQLLAVEQGEAEFALRFTETDLRIVRSALMDQWDLGVFAFQSPEWLVAKEIGDILESNTNKRD